MSLPELAEVALPKVQRIQPKEPLQLVPSKSPTRLLAQQLIEKHAEKKQAFSQEIGLAPVAPATQPAVDDRPHRVVEMPRNYEPIKRPEISGWRQFFFDIASKK